jgi:hypothetical protein
MAISRIRQGTSAGPGTQLVSRCIASGEVGVFPGWTMGLVACRGEDGRCIRKFRLGAALEEDALPVKKVAPYSFIPEKLIPRTIWV